jgi:hypothetical protein
MQKTAGQSWNASPCRIKWNCESASQTLLLTLYIFVIMYDFTFVSFWTCLGISWLLLVCFSLKRFGYKMTNVLIAVNSFFASVQRRKDFIVHSALFCLQVKNFKAGCDFCLHVCVKGVFTCSKWSINQSILKLLQCLYDAFVSIICLSLLTLKQSVCVYVLFSVQGPCARVKAK